MNEPKDIDAIAEDDYKESEDSDFEIEDAAKDDSGSENDDATPNTSIRPTKRRKIDNEDTVDGSNELGDLDSGDEATIRQAKSKRKSQKAGAEEVGSDGEDEGWRAKTRAMKEKQRYERKKAKLASAKGSTIDVDKLWAEMNRPGSTLGTSLDPLKTSSEQKQDNQDLNPERNLPQKPVTEEEMVTIKRTYKFAGQIHAEEKTVPKSSAEARLWLAQQAARGGKDAADTAETPNDQPIRRPLRRISRFDPNFNNMDAFIKTWAKNAPLTKELKGPKLNVVEKSKMDWATHVDTEGLKDELDHAARGKEGYLGRMDFLNQVEANREEEARLARSKG